jgi:hypothetical protein
MQLCSAAARSAVAAAFAAAILFSSAAAQDQSGGPAFKAGASSASNANYTLSVASDGKKGTLLLDHLEVGGGGAAGVVTQVFSISLPLTGAENGAKLRISLEGHVYRLKGTDISLVTTVNGQTNAMDFAKFSSGQRLMMGQCEEAKSAREGGAAKHKVAAKDPAAAKKKFRIFRKAAEDTPPALLDDDYVQCTLVNVPSASDMRLNAVLLLHRQTTDVGSYVNVTTITLHVLN